MGFVREDGLLDVGREFELAYTKFCPESEVKKVLLISSATSVPQEFYWKFAGYLAENGIAVYTFDYSGIGRSGSSIEALKLHSGGVKSWGSVDQTKITELVLGEYPNHKICLVTHSIGGQVLGFNPLNLKFEKVIMAASQSASWYMFKGFSRFKIYLFFNFFMRRLTPIFGYYPGSKVGIFEDLPGSMAMEWSRWGNQKEYMMQFHNENEYHFDQLKAEVRSYSFENDWLASKIGVDWLAKQYPKARVDRIHFTGKVNGLEPKHFGFFREHFKETFWESTLNWILE
ncbi:alpha/beta hydrolase family protein [Croceivirga thetidis]|uniref:Hydrolase n=1 Tax=Croceivirga thetidis TaxID=2721623 RepID=A0ABX1GT12_9FLAO|nr:alpha/beta fold hydrolase [Croceivirga thetidis]NKI33095.1 hydrolase [Croceivirga thetidis]